MARYIVTAGYATAVSAVPGGPPGAMAWQDIPRGALLPDDVPQEQVEQLLHQGLIESVPVPVSMLDPAPAAPAKRRRKQPGRAPAVPAPGGDRSDVPVPEVEAEPAPAEGSLAEPTQSPEPVAGPASPEPGPVEEVPAGTLEQVITWVGDEKGRAAAALAAEQAALKPRNSLIRQLVELAGQGKDTL